LLRVARPVFRLSRPMISLLSKQYRAYRKSILAGLYNDWAKTNSDACYLEESIDYQPLISIVVPVYNPSYSHLMEMVYSAVNQHYENWELILVNASDKPGIRDRTARCSEIDERIVVMELENNSGISGNTNAGIKKAKGEYIAFGDHDDLLHPCALHSIAEALQANPKPQMLYTDEDKVSSDSSRYLNPHIKPDWSVDTLRNVNFITHLTVVEKSLVDQLNGLRSITDGAQDYDFLLRVWDEFKPEIRHIPRILYHWRMAEGSTADLAVNKGYLFKAGRRALDDHVKRNKIKARARIIEGKPGYYELEYHPVPFSIVIGPTAPARQAACVSWIKDLLEDYEHDNVELIVGDWYEKFGPAKPDNPKVKVVQSAEDYWSEALAKASQDVTICFKTAAFPIDKKNMFKLAAAAADQDHSAVAPIIVDSQNTIVSSGIIFKGGLHKRLFEGYKMGSYTWFSDTDWVREVNDLSTEIVAAPTNYLRRMFSAFDYAQIDVFGSMLSKEALKDTKFVVWAHAPFKRLGNLNPSSNIGYQSVEPFRFTSVVNPETDLWWKKFERDDV
jgi:glycosyltransferase involved in cell wall biosynthesis